MAVAPLAEPGQRLVARIVDTLIVGLPVIVVLRELVSGPDLDVVAPPVVAGCMFVYESIQLALWGRTIGKRSAGVEVVATGPDGRPLGGEPGGEPGGGPGRGAGTPLGIPRAVLRAAVYSLPIALRPIPALGLLAGVFWVVNAGLLFEGNQRQALHDRLNGTLVVKRPSGDSQSL